MDEVVRRAMAKWPDVPAVFGWLALDARGQWLLRDERIGNALLNEFIGRNYAADSSGRWYFQNGPQRVFVTLAYAPWVLRLSSAQRLVTHTGRLVETVRSAWMDRAGIVVLDTEHGAGVVDDRDVESFAPWLLDATGDPLDDDRLAESIERTQEGRGGELRVGYAGRTVALLPIQAEEVPARLGFVRVPQPLPDERAVS